MKINIQYRYVAVPQDDGSNMSRGQRDVVWTLSELPDDLILKVLGMLDPVSQCIAAQVSTYWLKQVNTLYLDCNISRLQAARDYISSCARAIASSVQSARNDEGKVFEENLAQVPAAIRQDVEKSFLNELAITIPDDYDRSVALLSIVKHIITLPGPKTRAIDLANTIPHAN